MKALYYAATPLACALLLFAFGQPVQAQGNYCWCVRPDGVCENHRTNTAGEDILCGSTTGAGCSEYCASRTTDGTPWVAAHCDTSYIARSSSSTSEGGTVTCPPAGAAPSTPTSGATPSTGGPSTESIRLFNPLGSDVTIPQFIGRGVRAVVGIVGAVALLMFIYGGIAWMTAGGSEERIKSAKNILKNSLIGILLIFFSYTIISIFFSVLRG